MSKNIFLALSILLFTSITNAVPEQTQITEIEYNVFYSHLRKLDPEEFDALQFAFGFKKHNSDEMCQLKKVLIHTPKKDMNVRITTQNRFTLPKEKALKLAEATVKLDFAYAPSKCDMSVLLQANPEWLGEEITSEKLRYLNSQFKAFFESMGGGLFSFLMPETKGIKLHLNSDYAGQQLLLGKKEGITHQAKLLLVADHWIEANQQSLPIADISHITAWVESE